jgi:hypothetical protein
MDDITQLIWNTLTPEAQETPPDPLQESFSFDPDSFSLEEVIRLLYELSHRYLHRIPPLAFLSTTRGASYTGLSFFQLRKIFERHRAEAEVLSVGITRVMTGQTFSLMFQFTPRSQGTMSISWGEDSLQEEVRKLVWNRLGLD